METENAVSVANVATSAVNGAPEVKLSTDKINWEKLQEKVFPLKIEANFEDIFVTEKDTFEVKVQYYKEGTKFFVESVDDDFSKEHGNKEMALTFKLPNQGDVTNIIGMVYSGGKTQATDVVDFTRLELARMMCLIRKWSSDKKIDNENLLALNPKVVKAILNKIRESIGADGIF